MGMKTVMNTVCYQLLLCVWRGSTVYKEMLLGTVEGLCGRGCSRKGVFRKRVLGVLEKSIIKERDEYKNDVYICLYTYFYNYYIPYTRN